MQHCLALRGTHSCFTWNNLATYSNQIVNSSIENMLQTSKNKYPIPYSLSNYPHPPMTSITCVHNPLASTTNLCPAYTGLKALPQYSPPAQWLSSAVLPTSSSTLVGPNLTHPNLSWVCPMLQPTTNSHRQNQRKYCLLFLPCHLPD